MPQKKQGGSWGRPAKSAKEIIEDIPHFDQVLYEVVKKRLEFIVKEMGEASDQFKTEDRIIFMESWARTLVMASK